MSQSKDTAQHKTVDSNWDGEDSVYDQASDGTQSIHNYFEDLYQTILPAPVVAGFPLCHLSSSFHRGPSVYIGSLLNLGNGTPLFEPLDKINVPEKRLLSGITIGDVGLLHEEGHFEHYFNIFLPKEDETQAYCPPNMIPLHPPLDPTEIAINPMHFPPGTVLASKGVDLTKISLSPLEFTISTKARESSVLILPDGASREDLLSTTRVRDYVQKHALEWYKYANNWRRNLVPNGLLCVVTGCDKASTWETLCTGPYSLYRGTVTGHYRDGHWNNRHGDWGISGFRSRSDPICSAGKSALFIRTMKVALNIHDWKKYNGCEDYEIPYYTIPSVPIIGLKARFATFLERRFSHYYEKRPRPDRGYSRKYIFHPLDVILQILLQESPTARVAFVEDDVWSGVVDGENTSSGLSLLSAVIKQNCKTWNRRRKIQRKLSKVWPGPRLPDTLFYPREPYPDFDDESD
ncbi:hypothetical protein CVT25_004141 [Psilocybe cyanescens]|uniref:Uncharacterized protein n=1 Tax=Psilocybe cyanescens TaxID=93625 RepID=A0A409XKV4_PSICY|nr:hypothetical protein CVT25_004141 [Psilocybe cyanescens]